MKKLFTLIIILTVMLYNCSNITYAQTPTYTSSITQKLKAPIKSTIDASDNIYVTDDYTKSILKYDANGNFLQSFNISTSPLSVAVDNNGQLFVGDGKSGIIYKVSTNGSSIEFNKSCKFPSSMNFGSDGNLYIADGLLKEVLVIDKNGILLKTIGSGTLAFPSEVLYDKINSRILVAENGGIGSGSSACKIWKFNLNGNLIGSFASSGNNDGQFYRIQGMTIGKCNNLYVCDPFQGSVTIFDKNDNFVSKFGQFGTSTGNLNVPLSVNFDTKERIIITSMNNGSIEVFNTGEVLPTSNISNSDAIICSNQSANININFSGIAPWKFTYSVNGLNPVDITTSTNPYILNTSNPGLYEIVKLSDANNTGTCFSGSAKITINQTSSNTVNTSICEGNSYQLGNQILTTAGTYNETLKSICGCDSAVTVNLSINKKPVSFYTFVPNGLSIDFTNNSQNSTNFTWNFGDGQTSNLINPTHNFNTPSIYNVSLTASNGNCKDSIFTQTIDLTSTSIKKISNKSIISISPNPSNGLINLELSNIKNSTWNIIITNEIGQNVYNENYSNSKETIDLSGLSSGVYMIKITSNEISKTEKLVISK